MLRELKLREQAGQPIKVGLIGAGAMGSGIARQIGKTPGMELTFIADRNIEKAETARDYYGRPSALFDNPDHALDSTEIDLDVLVEATASVSGARYSLKAIQRKAHVVLMNGLVDIALAPYLQAKAREQGVVVTSDAGDQHGVLIRMIEEIQLWGFNIIQAGNIKGFLDRYATADQKRDIAKKLNLNIIQCIAFTDGTKLNIEMALIGNAVGLTPYVAGMQGPTAQQVMEVLDLFDFDAYQGQGRVDYIVGAEPGGGVYVVGYCEDLIQKEYLKYYKVKNHHPYYLFYRPYHLCHIETPRAIALAGLWGKALLEPQYPRLTDVYAHAKTDLKEGDRIEHAIGGDQVYGLIHPASLADQKHLLPIALLETERDGLVKPHLRRGIEKDQPLTWSDVDLPETEFLDLYREQQSLLEKNVVTAIV